MPVPVRRLDSGTIWVDAVPSALAAVARRAQWGTENGHTVAQVICEVGSGLNGKRPRLWRILSDPSATVVLVEHRDRLARLGLEYLEAALSAQGRRVVVADPSEALRRSGARHDRGLDVDGRTVVWPARYAQPCDERGYWGAVGAR